MDNTKKWYDILEDLLQCCVCLEIPTSIVTQCSSGHIICCPCKKKLTLCPICKQNFIDTKSLVAEDIISRIQDIKLCIAQEIMEKLQQQDRLTVNTSTQTSFDRAKTCASTQTDNAFPNEKKKKKPIVHYQCCIGSCASKCSYRLLIQHLRERHRNTLYNIYQGGDVINQSFVIDIDKLPINHDYALLVNNINLFFLKIQLHSNGQLIANLQLVDKNVGTTLFQYRFLLTDGSYYLRRRGMVTSCLVQKEVASLNSIRMDEKEMSTLIRAKSIQCTVIIKKNCVGKVIDTRPNE